MSEGDESVVEMRLKLSGSAEEFFEHEVRVYHARMHAYAKYHYVEADRKHRIDRFLKLWIVVLTIFVLSIQGLVRIEGLEDAVVARVGTDFHIMDLSTVAFSTLLVIVSMLQFLLNYSDEANQHRTSAANYSECRRQLENLYAATRSGHAAGREKLESIKAQIGMIGRHTQGRRLRMLNRKVLTGIGAIFLIAMLVLLLGNIAAN